MAFPLPVAAVLAKEIKIPVWARWLLGGILLSVLVFVAFSLWISDVKDDAVQKDRVERNAETLETNAKSHERAAVQRSRDVQYTHKLEEDYLDVIHEEPARTGPSAAHVRLNCERLRKAGYLDADLPESCGSGGGVEADTYP